MGFVFRGNDRWRKTDCDFLIRVVMGFFLMKMLTINHTRMGASVKNRYAHAHHRIVVYDWIKQYQLSKASHYIVSFSRFSTAL